MLSYGIQKAFTFYSVLLFLLILGTFQGSAAACRGGTSSSTADKVALFLVHLACARKAAVPYAQDSNFEVDLLAYDGGVSGTSFSFAMSAAAAFGSMLCIHDGRPIWKQRITHNTVKYLEPILKANEETGVKPTTETLGLVAIVCHIICAGNFKNISLPTRGVAVRAAVRNLVSGPLYDNENLKNPIVASNLVSVKKLMIASILKLSSSSPGLVSFESQSV